jgi:hypothetical protein
MDVYSSDNEVSLRPGDILLFHGHGFVSWVIRRFDESDVCGSRGDRAQAADDG